MSSPSIRSAQVPGALHRVAVPAAALLAVAVWGATPVATKLAVAGLDPFSVGLLRTLLACLLALPLVLSGSLQPPREPAGRGLLAVSALCGFVLFPILFSLGLGRTSAGHGALILAVLPIFTGLIAAAVERRLPGRRWWAGAVVALAGAAFLIGQRFGLGLDGASLLGDLMVLASAVAASAGYVAGARAARRAGTWAVTVWGLVLGGLVLLPVLPLALVPGDLAQVGPAVWLSLLYLAAGSSILAYAAWYWALGRGGIARMGLMQFAQPVIGLALAAAVLAEPLTWPLVLAAGTIVGGLAIARSDPPVRT